MWVLVEFLDNKGLPTQGHLVEVLDNLGERVTPLLLSVLRDQRSPNRFEAFSVLKKLIESGQLDRYSKFNISLFLVLGSVVLLAAFGIFAISSLGLFYFLILISRNPSLLSYSGYLLLPEEMIAELIALKRRLQKQNLPQWKLNLELTTEVLWLLWAVHIEIRLQNFSLPPSKKRNID